MANLKNNFKSKNLHFLSLAFEQAKINLGSTKTNPSVGCIVEKDGAVISSGHTSLNGRPHAEYNALNKRKDFKNANLYVTLEPCSHYGATPPCTNIIKKKKLITQFFERDTGFNFPVNITKLKRNDAKWKYTFFHNFFFNPNLNENIEILHFSPIKAAIKKIT